MIKKILFLLTFLLTTLGGGNSAWADTTHELILNSGATEKTNGDNAVVVPQGEQSTCYFKIIDTSGSGAYNYNSKYYGYYGGVHYTNGLKIQSNTKLYFTTSSIATVTIVQATKANNDSNYKGIKFGISGNTTSYAYTDAVTPSEVSETTERVRVYTFANQAAGSYAIEQNDGESGLFYVRVVESGNTFEWNFAKPISAIDLKLLNGEKTEWNLDGGDWKHTGNTPADNGPFAQNGKELEHVYGLKVTSTKNNNNNFISSNSKGYRLGNGNIRIPSLNAGDKVTVLFNNYKNDENRGINRPSNITEANAEGWGEQSQGQHTCVGYVSSNGDVDLEGTSAIEVKTITVESSNKPWPTTLSFEKCAASATVNVKIPYGASTATYTNTLVAPVGCGTVSYDVLLGNATVDAYGVVTINAVGEVIVRATTAGGENYSAYYCDYIINATATEFTEYNSSADRYEWRFYDDDWWVTESSQLETSSNNWWYLENGYYKYKQNDGNLSDASLVTTSPTPLPETNNLTFTATKGRVGIKIGSELLLGVGAKITLPDLIAGARVTVRANAHTSNKTITVDNGSEPSFDLTTATQDFTFTVSSAGHVSLTNNSDDNMRIYAIVVEKPEFTFSEYQTTYWDGTTTTVTKTVPYKADGDHKFSVGANVPSGASLTWENFTISSSNNSVVSATLSSSNFNYDTVNNKVWFSNLVTGNAGTAVLTFTFKGNSNYASKSFTVTLNVVTVDPTFTFTYNDKNLQTEDYTTGTITKGMNLPTGVTLATEGESPNEQKAHGITFASSNTEVATVDQYTGKISFLKPGITVITANFAGNDVYNAAKTYFSLLINGNTPQSGILSWDETGNTPTTPTNGVTRDISQNSIKYTASLTGGESGTVKYMSSDTEIATVTSAGEVVTKDKHPGTVHIYAYVNGSVDGETYYNCHYLDYQLTVNGGDITINFEPASGTVTTGYVLMPRLIIPSIEKGNITTLSLTSSDPNVASVPDNLLDNEYLSLAGTRIEAVYPKITGVAPGTATITASFESPYYNSGATVTAEYHVTVTNNTGNFSWATPKTEFTIVEGEFMMMPSITGNANGNIDGLSKGSVNAARQGYVYEIKGSNRSITYNTEDYYYGQGVPDYTLTPAAVNGGKAYIYWIKGMDDSHPALMIYGESAGDLTLTATDSQTGYSPGNITIHVVSKDDNVKTAEATFWNNNKFPFTWDFTNIAPADITDDEVHWKTKYYGTVSSNAMDLVKNADPGCHLLGMASSFDYNYSDEQDTDNLIAKNKSGDGKDPQTIAKYICNGEGSNCKVMPAFHGIRIALGNNSYGRFHHKRDKVKLFDTSTQYPRLYLEGGLHYLYLPAVGSSKTPGTDYKLFMKVKGHVYQAGDAGNSSHVDVDVLSDDKGNPSTTSIASQYVITENNNYDVKVIGFDIPAEHAGKAIRLGFDKNVDIYWIAYSTEEKLVKRQSNTSYHAATYSYGQDLDIEKSQEANKDVKAYYTTSFSNGKTLAMTPITNSQTTVPSGTGIMLKADKGGSFDNVSSYMVASARNTDNYITPSSLSGNLLVATPSTGTVDSQETIENKTYTNFLLSYRYMTYDWENGSIVNDTYMYAPDWVFYRIKPYGIASASNMAYLHVEGNMFVDANGNIVNLSRRNSASEETDNQDGPIAPASQNMLKIIFLDEDPIEDSGTTDISTVNERTIDTDAWYTLQGVRVNAPAKGGIYIHKGKKVVVK